MKDTFPTELGSHPDFPESTVAFDSDLGFYHTTPYPTEAALEKFYTKEYRDIRQESPDESYVAFMRHRALVQSSFILEASGKNHFESVLDIGCGCGELLNALQPHSKQLHGFETDHVMASHAITNRSANSIDIRNEHYSSQQHPLECDLITMSHVLEHIPEPAKFLQSLREESLAANGLMFIEVPNDPLYWLQSQIDREQKGLGHLNYFTPDSLASTLNRAGFKTLDIRLCGITLQQHIRRLDRGKVGRFSARVKQRLFPMAGKLPDYTCRREGEDGIYLQALAVASH
jgi:2-polyprenyl-3-methyl-5-hydroxy-6-metoxy-1,4-benzoquinol methylase